ncbi:S41 family peptidase [Pedomonas mirosovicensis]|uniref:S41 family peptidase n=1 Tax=Pedomonas mirosovicensis TaxID=2908641 RepID=UPI002169535A|nr:S41 family peptidase [Pedomonas mirosovicensis]MCH8684551.1 S41 family peptidase [Pedomonas mirosovicensis]
MAITSRRRLFLAATVAWCFAAPPAFAAPDLETYRQLDQLMDVFERVRAEYVEKVDDKKLLEGAIQGMLASLDPHSSFLDARDFELMRTQTEGEYGGLGIEVTMEDGAVKVVSPIDDTPASRANIKAGDYITHINKEPIFGTTLNEAVSKMKGPPKSTITLTIVREGANKPFDVTLTREIITLRPVRYEVKGNVGYIRIAQFSKPTGPGLRKAISELQQQIGADRVTGYVLDLRRNPGGLLDQAIEVSDVFLERGEIVSQRGRRKQDIQRYYARSGDLTGGKPVVVLVDEASASASEIVAGALQDQRRAIVVGQRTFGKGSVQTLIPLSPDTALRLTTARYYTPAGRSVQELGIEPDIEVPQLSDPDLEDRMTLREADLRNHLLNGNKAGERLEEKDDKPDPRFQNVTAESLKKQGITDYQLDYALKLLRRINGTISRLAAK